MKIVIFNNPDGTITVRVPVQNPLPESDAARRSGETEDEHFERLVSGPNRKGGSRVAVIEDTDLPIGHSDFKAARRWDGVKVTVDMPTAREIHAESIAVVQAAEIARLKIEERSERLKSNTTQADSHAATITALEALDLNVLATQIAAAPNPTALSAIWPADVPR